MGSLALQYKVAYKSVGAFRSYYYHYYCCYDQGISLVVTFHLFWSLRWDSDRRERSISAGLAQSREAAESLERL